MRFWAGSVLSVSACVLTDLSSGGVFHGKECRLAGGGKAARSHLLISELRGQVVRMRVTNALGREQ